MDNEIASQLTQIEIGLDAEAFFKTTMGKYLQGIAQMESDQASSELKYVDPSDSSKIIELQIKAQVAEAALKWLAEAILIGRQSEFTLEQQELEAKDG